MFYAVLDLRTHVLSFSSAGQYPFPLISNGEEVHVLECSGRPLGMFADARYSRRVVSLASARRMLLLSDGILELLPPSPTQHKLDEIKERLLAGADIERLVPGMDGEEGPHCRDDVTLLLVERSPT
jgi:serine phosphatase RsbU (regulator of sigma subunit)